MIKHAIESGSPFLFRVSLLAAILSHLFTLPVCPALPSQILAVTGAHIFFRTNDCTVGPFEVRSNVGHVSDDSGLFELEPLRDLLDGKTLALQG